ncbi:hypothetical protein Tco_1511554 [Tanacetum coccineum]
MFKIYKLCTILVDFTDMAPLPPHEQRHQYLRYEGLQYTDADIVDFEMRLANIYKREDADGAPGCSGAKFGEAVLDIWRQPDAEAGSPEAAEDAPIADKGALAVIAPVHAPWPPPPAVGPARTMA